MFLAENESHTGFPLSQKSLANLASGQISVSQINFLLAKS